MFLLLALSYIQLLKGWVSSWKDVTIASMMLIPSANGMIQASHITTMQTIHLED